MPAKAILPIVSLKLNNRVPALRSRALDSFAPLSVIFSFVSIIMLLVRSDIDTQGNVPRQNSGTFRRGVLPTMISHKSPNFAQCHPLGKGEPSTALCEFSEMVEAGWLTPR